MRHIATITQTVNSLLKLTRHIVLEAVTAKGRCYAVIVWQYYYKNNKYIVIKEGITAFDVTSKLVTDFDTTYKTNISNFAVKCEKQDEKLNFVCLALLDVKFHTTTPVLIR